MMIISKICSTLQLGSITEPPQRLTGGFLHRMYSLSTDRGHYAVKLLNPEIMARPHAMSSFLRAEELENRLEQASIPILPALRFSDKKMQQIDGQFFYIFDWFDGRALKSEEVTDAHCRSIAAQLARIHGIEHRESGSYNEEPVDWEFLAAQLSAKNPVLGQQVARHLSLLHEMESRAASAFPRLPQIAAICHNDMDCKNVLWHGDTCRIIDLECLGWSNPFIELYETALCWSGIEHCSVNPRLFDSFIRAYQDAGGTLPDCWTVVHDANCGRLGWLAYNLRRALGMDCLKEEIATGESEVRKTIAQLAHYEHLRNKLV